MHAGLLRDLGRATVRAFARLRSRPVNVVFGIGSFKYQHQTRDTFGFAMKATNVTIDGEDVAIFKSPKTDSGVKKSARGRLVVIPEGCEEGGKPVLVDRLDEKSPEERATYEKHDLLEEVWRDGKFVKEWTFDQVRATAQK